MSVPSGPCPSDDGLRLLAGRAAAGDRPSARALLDRVAAPVRRVVRTVLGPGHRVGSRADDVAQDALVAVVRSLGSFRGESGFVHYACRIAVRVAMAERRARALEIETEPLDPADEEIALVAGDDLEAPRRRALLRALVDELPEAQAETIVLRIMLGYSIVEVAGTMGVPVNTVRSRLRLAKEALRSRIEGDEALCEMLEVG